jgi:hypothetical protein
VGEETTVTLIDAKGPSDWQWDTFEAVLTPGDLIRMLT